MNIYIAASYRRKGEVKAVAHLLEATTPHVVVGRWFDEPYSASVKLAEVNASELRKMAVRDYHAIKSAVAVLFFSEVEPQPPRGGRHVEFGIAMALCRLIFVVGPRENCFHYAPGIEHFDTVEEALQRIRTLYP